jgi:hypothetical protein
MYKNKSFPISTAVILEQIGPRRRVCIITMHLEAAQSADGVDKRSQQIHSPLKWAAEQHFEKENLPLIIAGD